MREKAGERNQFRKESIAANRERKTETTNGNNGKIVCNKMYFTVPRTGDWATLRGPRKRTGCWEVGAIICALNCGM